VQKMVKFRQMNFEQLLGSTSYKFFSSIDQPYDQNLKYHKNLQRPMRWYFIQKLNYAPKIHHNTCMQK
jgi:hypothetical protein